MTRMDGLSPFAAMDVPHLRQRPRVQDLFAREPALSRRIHARAHVPQPQGVVRIRVDRTHQPAVRRLPPVPPVHVEPPRTRVQFDDHAVRERRIGDRSLEPMSDHAAFTARPELAHEIDHRLHRRQQRARDHAADLVVEQCHDLLSDLGGNAFELRGTRPLSNLRCRTAAGRHVM